MGCVLHFALCHRLLTISSTSCPSHFFSDIYTFTMRTSSALFLFLPVLLLLSQTGLYAQPYSAFTTVRQELHVFDNGMVHRIEPLLPVAFKIGRNGLAYQDNQRLFKIYRNGAVQVVSDLFTTQFDVSDNLILFRSANMISVVDDGEVTLLSRLCDRYLLGDSIVLFYDNNRQTFNAYAKGKITELETFLNIGANDFRFDSTVKASDNIAAYISFNDQFKIFFNGELETLENQAVNKFQVGRNTAAWVDINNIFKIYHQGQTYTIDPFAPESFAVGDDVVAFQSYDGYFKIFYKGNLFTLGFYKPQYQVADRVVVFQDLNGFFKIFHEGEQTMVDNYYPDKFLLGYNSMAYVNKANVLRMFSKGKINDVTTMNVLDMRLDYDVLQFKVGFNAFRFFYNGEYYN